MAFHAENARDRHPGKGRGQPFNVFDFEAGDAQPMADFIGLGVDLNEFC
jgi:hypothetical protein